jgi:DNA-directed RNA polymerase subunit RPC12/RpoP
MEGLNVLKGLGATRRLDGSRPVDEAAYLYYMDEEDQGECSTTEGQEAVIPMDQHGPLRGVPYPPRSKLKAPSRIRGVACKQCGFSDSIEIEVETIVYRSFTLESDGKYHENPLLPRHSEETITYVCGNCHSIISNNDVAAGARFVCDSKEKYDITEEA